MPRIIPTVLAALLLWLAALSAAWACTGSCTTGGAIQYCSGTMKYCNGTTWTDLPAVGTIGACTMAGNIDYLSNKLRYCNATPEYKYLYCESSPATDGTCSTAGQIAYDADNTRLEFCDGTNWVQMVACSGGGGGGTTALFCWGDSTSGKVGNGTTTPDVSAPTLVALPTGVTTWKDIAVSSNHNCAIGSNDQLYCWGAAANGKLGNGTTTPDVTAPSNTPVALPTGVTSWKDVTASLASTCAIANTNQLYCWGAAASGQLGNGTSSGDVSAPANTAVGLPAGVTSWKSVAGGNGGACAIGSNDQLYCWGSATFGQLGNGTSTPNTTTPGLVTLPSGVTSWTFAGEATGFIKCAIANTGNLYCWGTNANGQFGNGVTGGTATTPQLADLPAGATSWTQVSTSGTVACGTTNNGALYCWGSDNSGGLGIGAGTTTATPTGVTLPTGVTSWTNVRVGTNGGCAVGNNGLPYCWGESDDGRLGNGTITPDVEVPTLVTVPGGVSSFTAVDGGGSHYCGFGTTGGGGGDVTAPTLLSSTPGDEDTAVALNANIVLNFSENVQAGTGDITVEVSGGFDSRTIAITDTSQVSFSGSTVTINMSTDLTTQGATYHVTMPSGVIKDTSNNVYAGLTTGQLNFTTLDTMAPTVAGFTPMHNATNVALNSNIVMQMSEGVQAGTGSITIEDLTGSTGMAEFTSPTYDTSSTSYGTGLNATGMRDGNFTSVNSVHKTDDFQFYQWVKLEVGAGEVIDHIEVACITGQCVDLNGATVSASQDGGIYGDVGTISLAADGVYTTVDIATTVPSARYVQVYKVSAEPVAVGDFRAYGTGGTTYDTRTIPIGDSQVNIGGNYVTINPTTDLAANRQYQVYMPSGILKDMVNNDFAGVASGAWSFHTLDTMGPQLYNTDPIDEATGVGLSANIVLNFNENVVAGTGNIEIIDVTGSGADTRTIAVGDTSQVTFNLSSQMTIDPTADLLDNHVYTVVMSQGVVEDTLGNEYAGLTAGDLNFTTVDTVAPALIGTTPADDETGVASTVNFVMNFNEDVQAGTGNFVIKRVSDNVTAMTIPITDFSQVTFSGSTVSIDPTLALPEGTAYYVNIASGVIEDTSYNNYPGISDTTTWNFMTVDTTPPTLSSTTPTDGATAVSVSANLVMNFSESVQAGTGNFLIKRTSDNVTVATISITDATQVTISGSTVTVNPTSNLASSTGFYVNIASGVIKDMSNNNYAGIANTTAWNFTTGDGTPPTLSSTTPADGATNVARAANMVMNFSESVQAGTGNFILKRTSDNVTVATISITDATQVTISGSTVTVNPTSDLASNTGYYVNIASGVIKDLSNNDYAGISNTTSWNFTTVTDSAAPTLSSTTPSDNANNVASTTNLVMNFNENVAAGTGNFIIRRSSDSVAVATISIADATQVTISGSTVTINPTLDLAGSTAHYVNIASGVIKDTANNNYAGISNTTSWNFTTAADATAPTLSSSTPVDGATNVTVSSNIVLNFSENVQVGTGNIVITDLTNGADTRTIAVGNAQVTFSGGTVTINPTTDLLGSKSYQVTMASGVIKDLANNNYAGLSAGQLDFTTPDLVPTLSSSTPADNATGISVSDNIVLTFSENMQAGTGNIVITDLTAGTDTRTIAVGNAQVSISGSTVTINPTTDLITGRSYEVTMASGVVKDMTNNDYAGLSTGQLNFGVGDTPPLLTSSTPVDNATGVSSSADIVLNFNENVQAGTGNIVLFTTRCGGTYTKTISVTDATQVTISGSTITINPTTNLATQSAYDVQIGSGVIKDMTNNNWTGVTGGQLNFTTAGVVPAC